MVDFYKTTFIHICFFTAVLFLSGCTTNTPVYISELEVIHKGWDTLTVNVAFTVSTPLGGEKVLQPEHVSFVLFNQRYDTLFASSEPVIVVPDRESGNREKMILEVCGSAGAATVCDQKGVLASPKRIRLDYETGVDFPVDGNFERGRYNLEFVVERQHFDGDEWEVIDRKVGLEGYLLAYVHGKQRDPVKIPIRGTTGQFDLAQLDRYRDFKYYLRSTLHDKREADVYFDVYAGLKDDVVKVASLQQHVRLKTDRERKLEVYHFVEQAAERIISKLESYRRAHAYVDDWTYDEITNTYSVEVEIRWRSRSSRRNTMRGTLQIKEDGTGGRFTPEEANRRVHRIWEEEIRSEDLAIENLDVLSAPEPAALSDALMEEGW